MRSVDTSDNGGTPDGFSRRNPRVLQVIIRSQIREGEWWTGGDGKSATGICEVLALKYIHIIWRYWNIIYKLYK